MRKMIPIPFAFTVLMMLTALPGVQGQQPWGLPSSVWHYNDPPLNGDPYSAYYRWEYKGDTVIADMACSVIGNDDREEYMYEEDGKVYYWRGGQFRRIYDFSAAQGDTIQLTYPAILFNEDYTEWTDTLIDVTAVVDSVWPNSVSPTLMSFLVRSLPDTAYPTVPDDLWPIVMYTERIGSHSVMIDQLVGIYSVMYTPVSLRCYSDNDIDHVESWWTQQDKPCDHQLSVGIAGYTEEDDLLLYPNPATDVCHVRFPPSWAAAGMVGVEVVNMVGATVLSTTASPQEGSASIAVGHLSPGLYTVRLRTSERQFPHLKLIIR